MGTIVTTSVRNDTGAWEVIEREPGTAADLALAEVSAQDIGGELGQELLLRLVDDQGAELACREIIAR